ncbi:hypothetical protein [Piscirickettsia litoralis]|uniref:hypothetical protein n=1 Tax=Piscirickettsia litoralis TaxID=1891921 RepID=UPI001112F577|nr:hypothetical protein [Piscirickettsia litoralis]
MTYVTYTLNSSALWVVVASITMAAPQVFLIKVYRYCLEKYSLSSVLLLTTLMRAVITFMLVFADSMAVILMIIFCRSILVGFIQPASAAYASVEQEKGNRRIAASLSLIGTFSKIFAPLLGGSFW